MKQNTIVEFELPPLHTCESLRAYRKARLNELLPVEKETPRRWFLLWALLVYAVLFPLLFMQGVFIGRL